MIIKELELYTTQLAQQTDFYSKVLGLKILKKSSKSVAFQIGQSTLKLTDRPTATPYHFAINIPKNKVTEALQWLKSRVEILKDGTSEVQYFDFWDANAIYFYDNDKNIVELIGRNTLDNASDMPFDVQQLLNISEIGVPTTNIRRVYELLNKRTVIPIYSGGFERFCSVGDAHGLFIIINKDLKKDWYPTQDEPYSSDFIIKFEEKERNFRIEYKNEKLRFY